ncbi:fimbrial biogenesis chaperone [Kerstersia sp.]|uniref:fimbrial biogenesis chaperone n=1 Tax=Kerstersia sp. TaxID=1930783 RepID=UPI003F8E79E0
MSMMTIDRRAGRIRRPAQAAASGTVGSWLLFLPLFLLLMCLAADGRAAALGFDENRYILEAGQGRKAVVVSNGAGQTALVHVTVDWGEAEQEGDVPLAVSRPLVEVPAQGNATLEVFFEGDGLPDDRESFFLLSFLDVPPATPESDGITMRLAARHRLKLFYRPALAMPPQAAREALRWSLPADGGAGAVQLDNPTPYYVTLVDLQARDRHGKACGANIAHLMLAPFARLEQAWPECQGGPGQLDYRYVTDNGVERLYTVALQPGQPVPPSLITESEQ